MLICFFIILIIETSVIAEPMNGPSIPMYLKASNDEGLGIHPPLEWDSDFINYHVAAAPAAPEETLMVDKVPSPTRRRNQLRRRGLVPISVTPEHDFLVPIRYWSDQEELYRTIHLRVKPTDTADTVAHAAAKLTRGSVVPVEAMIYLDDQNLPENKPLMSWMENILNGGILEVDRGWDHFRPRGPFV